ncbi:Thioredoxin H9, partial [Bienertia sinuspersici]
SDFPTPSLTGHHCNCLKAGFPRLMGQCWTRLCKGHHKRRHTGGKVQHITRENSWEEKLSEARQNDKIVVVKFSATWCKNCKEIAATYRELADKYPV